jgi:PhnB protein
MPVKPIPEGFHTVTPYLTAKGAAEALDFYHRAFGAVERYRMPGATEGSVGHAEFVIGDSIIMIADESPYGKSPLTLGGVSTSIVLYVEDVDSFFARAVAAGATVTRPIEDQFYGDRTGSLVDPFGHHWHIMTHKEDVAREEMDRRLAELMAKKTAASNS